jgi:hypothetical protein
MSTLRKGTKQASGNTNIVPTNLQGFPMSNIWATKGIAEKTFVPRFII